MLTNEAEILSLNVTLPESQGKVRSAKFAWLS